MFKSTDQGSTWKEFNQGISAKNIYGFTKSTTRTFVSTNLGLFYSNQNSSAWVKSYPTNGYTTGNVIFADQSGNVFTAGTNVNTANYFSPTTIWKSTDNGTTWKADTAGFGAFLKCGTPQYFVDENNVQHLMLTNSDVAMYKKAPSDSKWIADTSGLGKGFSSYPSLFASDNRGFLYTAFIDYSKTPEAGIIFKRPITGGTWTVDTLGLRGHQVYNFSADVNGNMVLGTLDDGVYQKIGGRWTRIPTPSGLGGNAAFVTTFDKYGTLYAGFSNYDWNNFRYVWHGVYKTTNNGTNWTLVGLDSVAVRNLIIIGDTLFAVTYYKGIFKMPIQNSTEVKFIASIPNSVELFQNYPNPFNPTTTISYSIPAVETQHAASLHHVVLKIFDLLGREVATLVNEKKSAGNYKVTFDGNRLPSGVYFYQLKVGDYVGTKKLVLVK